MSISQMPSPINKYPAIDFWVSLSPSTPATTLSYSIVFLRDSAFLNCPCNGLSLTYHPAHQPLPSHVISLLPNLRCGPYHFNLHTTRLSTLISSSSIAHLLYSDDTQLFISTFPNTFSLISHTYNLLYLS